MTIPGTSPGRGHMNNPGIDLFRRDFIFGPLEYFSGTVHTPIIVTLKSGPGTKHSDLR